jgi:hypothetical protein
MITGLVIVDPLSNSSFDISQYTTKLSVSLSITATAQLTATVSDPGLVMLSKNVFSLRRLLAYKNVWYEVAAAEVRQGSASEELTIEFRSLGIQSLKRDKGQASFPGMSSTTFASIKAKEFGMAFFGESTPPKNTIVRVSNDKTDESTWDVLKRLASDNQFYLFETDQRLFFTSLQYLAGKFAVRSSTTSGFLATSIYWNQDPPTPASGAGALGCRCLTCPTMRRSDDDPDASGVDFQLERSNGLLFRPGMTVFVEGVPTFNDVYVISEVRWNEGETSSVSLSGIAPAPSTVDKAERVVDITGGGFSVLQVPSTL